MDNPKHLLLGLCWSDARVKVFADQSPRGLESSAEPDLPMTPDATENSLEASPLPGLEHKLVGEIKPYRKREDTEVTAIRLNLEVESFTYRKWGGLQTCKGGDWIVDRNGNVHTVDATSFASTYKQIGPATYVKQGVVWAAPASCDGVIATKEGGTHYKQGDFLVWNDKECKDGYSIRKEIFETLYEPAPAPTQGG